MTNREELQMLSSEDLAKRLVRVRYEDDKVEYLCPDGSVFNNDYAIRYTAMWLESEASTLA